MARTVLDRNRSRLDPAFVARESAGLPDGWSVSILQPITKDAEELPGTADLCARSS